MGNTDDPHSDRYRTQARRTASQRNLHTAESNAGILPTHHTTTAKKPKLTQAGGLSTTPGRDASPSASAAGADSTGSGGHELYGVRTGHDGPDPEKSTHNDVADPTSDVAPPAAPPPHKSEDASPGDSAIETADEQDKNSKPPITTRMKEGCKRFYAHTKEALFHSWVNVLLVFVPVGIIAEAIKLNPGAVFGINAIAIIPLAGLLTHATEAVASRLGDTWGALLNVTFGNSVELIIFIIALIKGEIRIVQASILGSILANLLLILGMAFFLGGLYWHEQIYNNTVTQMSACLLSISVVSLLLPTAFHASFKQASMTAADSSVLKVSRGTSVILLFVYVLYLFFQLRSHKTMYESTPQHVIDEESHPGMLAEMMNSSSSSESSSSSDSSDSDSSDSGSIVHKARKVKRMLMKRRKSSASTSTNATGPDKLASLSSPSTQEREDPLQHPFRNPSTSRRGSAGYPFVAEETDADYEDNGISRNFDWATHRQLSNDGSKSPEPKKRHKKHGRKEKKKRKHRKDDNVDGAADEQTQAKVEFADEITVVESPKPMQEQPTAQTSSPRMPFNMRQFSSRARPGLSKMLSNTVFMQPPPNPQPAQRPSVQRSQSAGGLRRVNSLPDRLGRQVQGGEKTQIQRTDPLPPFQHQRFPIRKVTSELSQGNEVIEDDEAEQPMSRTAACVLLLISTGLVAACAEFMVDAIPAMIGDGDTVSEAFIGLIILPIVGNAAEHVTAVTVAMKNKVDLAIGVAVGSSIQIALFVTPLVVLIGWIADTDMSLYFNLFETVSLFVTVFVVNFLVLDGRSNYLEGALLMSAYIIIALVSFFYPDAQSQSSVGGGGSDSS